MKHHYENESEMRQANPYLANHLATIAELIDGLYTAQTGGKIYTWENACLSHGGGEKRS